MKGFQNAPLSSFLLLRVFVSKVMGGGGGGGGGFCGTISRAQKEGKKVSFFRQKVS